LRKEGAGEEEEEEEEEEGGRGREGGRYPPLPYPSCTPLRYVLFQYTWYIKAARALAARCGI